MNRNRKKAAAATLAAGMAVVLGAGTRLSISVDCIQSVP